MSGIVATAGAGKATTLEEVKRGLQAAKEHALTLRFEAAEAFETYTGNRFVYQPRFQYGDSRIFDLDAIAESNADWSLASDPGASYFWAQSGSRWAIFQGRFNLVDNGAQMWARNRVEVNGETIWQDAIKSERDWISPEVRTTVDPVSVGYRVQEGGNGQFLPGQPWLIDELNNREARVQTLSDKRVELTIAYQKPGWRFFGTLDNLQNFNVAFDPGYEKVYLLDPTRSYLIERSSLRNYDEGLKPRDLPLFRVIDSRLVGSVWVPTKYVLRKSMFDNQSKDVTRVTLSNWTENPPDTRFTCPFRPGDLRATDIASATEAPYRYTEDGKWERLPSREDREANHQILEYALYIGGLAALIILGYSIPQLLKRRKSSA